LNAWCEAVSNEVDIDEIIPVALCDICVVFNAYVEKALEFGPVVGYSHDAPWRGIVQIEPRNVGAHVAHECEGKSTCQHVRIHGCKLVEFVMVFEYFHEFVKSHLERIVKTIYLPEHGALLV